MKNKRGVNKWELRTCARRGHATYAPDDEALAKRLSGVTGLGEVWRCLRCGEFTLGPPHGRGHADDAPLILRGKALRQAIIVRVLAVERWLRATLLALAAYAVCIARFGVQGRPDDDCARIGEGTSGQTIDASPHSPRAGRLCGASSRGRNWPVAAQALGRVFRRRRHVGFPTVGDP